jgi:hypothetical protein
MSRKGSSFDREKINFMISRPLIVQMKALIPQGERSDFINEVLHEALVDYGRRKAIEEMDMLRKKAKWSMTTQEIIAAKNYGRK